MAKRMAPAASVDGYIGGFPDKTQKLLRQLRNTIRKAAPGAEESVSYGIAGYKYKGVLVYFAGFANHVSIYPAPRKAPAFKAELAAFKGGVGTVQFPLDKPLPMDLIKRIVLHRVRENEERALVKKTSGSKAARPAANTTKAGTDPDTEKLIAWLDKLDKKSRTEIDTVRKIIRSASPKLQERIKWNAPSYYYKEDIVTFGPRRNNQLLLVFHHPAVVTVKSALLQGDFKDRRLVYFKNAAEAVKNRAELKKIIGSVIKTIEKNK